MENQTQPVRDTETQGKTTKPMDNQQENKEKILRVKKSKDWYTKPSYTTTPLGIQH
jgi:hypothetical protein